MVNKITSNGIAAHYDSFADVLYISVPERRASFRDLDKIISSIDDNGIIVRKNNGVISGITIDGFKSMIDDCYWEDSMILQYFADADIASIKNMILVKKD